jgi:hypothetical protein
MADVSPAGSAQAANFADAERREVVVVNVTLADLRRDRIEALLLGCRAKGSDG